MICNAKNGSVKIGDTSMDFVCGGTGEKPTEYLDIPISIDDYETIDLFNWQNEIKNMVSQLEFVRMVDVQAETIERYIRENRITPDMSVPIGDKRYFHYFYEDTIKKYAKENGWDLITPANIKEKFMSFIDKMDMSFSYKPVLLKAIFNYIDEDGKVRIADVVNYFIDFYEERKNSGLKAEKASSIYQKGGYTEKDVERNIMSNPFKRFANMRFLRRCKDVSYIEINPIIFKKLTDEDIRHILDVCDEKLNSYYSRIGK